MIESKVTKKSLAIVIFNESLAVRTAGKFDSNKGFRKHVIDRFVAEIKVTNASAASMYNQLKVMAESSDPTLVLGRDPSADKPVKVKRVKQVKVEPAPAEVADAV